MFETSFGGNMQTKAAADAEPRELDLLRRIESALAQPLLEGMPLGSTLTDAVVNELINQTAPWGFRQRWKDRLKWLRMRLQARKKCDGVRKFPSDRILVTWRGSTPRVNELIVPVIEALEPARTIVVYQNPEVPPLTPPGCFVTAWHDCLPHDPPAWAKIFRRCWPQWKAGLKQFCREADAPRGTYERFANYVLHASILLRGSLDFLRRCRPLAIVTEYDRGALWSCLVLAARQLGIPTFGILHGVLAPLPKAFRYGLADYQLCWGDYHRRNFLQAGEAPERLIVTGCPRLTRDLAADRTAVRERLGLNPNRPVVMLASAPYPEPERSQLIEIFAGCMDRLPEAAGIVRMHPSEKLGDYAEAAHRHPSIRFIENGAATLDESLATADVVVVHNSGVGGDALVKRRPVVVVEIPAAPPAHGQDLVEKAGCPRTTTAEELSAAVRALLTSDERRLRQLTAADRFVDDFCRYFGRESARKIADVVMGSPGTELEFAL